MQSTPERRIAIRNYLSQVRRTTISQLVQEFGVSRRTIQYDLDYLETELFVPILRECGHGGGISVVDGWFASQHYLSDADENFLRGLISGLQPDQQAKLASIIESFARPKAS